MSLVDGYPLGRAPWRDGCSGCQRGLDGSRHGEFEVVVGVDNIFDERSTEWPGFTGRHIYTGLSWRASEDAHANR
ncbi:MAG: hypothetical protein ACRELV_12475 [Longimicrobiales bacterium]